MIWIEGLLFLASSFFLVRSSYEMFVLTPLYGPQMVFYTLMHTWPERSVKLFFMSWSAYRPFVYFAVLFAVIRLICSITRAGSRAVGAETTETPRTPFVFRAIRWLSGPPGYAWSVLIYLVAALAAFHFGAAMTYDSWSTALFEQSV